jgi:hypothetical protein
MDSEVNIIDPELDSDSCARRRILAAIRNNIRLIVSVNPSKLTRLIEMVKEDAEWFLHELRSTRESLPIAIRIEAALRAGAVRARDLWPRLGLIVAWNSARLPFSTTSTEGIVTIPVDDHPSAGPLAITQGFFEFVHVRDIRDGSRVAPFADTLLYHELEDGQTYRLVLTNATGLCRLEIGDAYPVVGRYGQSPRLEFVGRVGLTHSFTGEKLSEEDVYEAVSRAVGHIGRGSTDGRTPTMFTVIPAQVRPPRYVVAIERSEGLPDPDALAIEIDWQLQTLNIEYGDKRQTARLGPVQVVLLRSKAFVRFQEDRVRHGASPIQVKHQWLQRDESLLRWFESHDETTQGRSR